MCTQRRCAPPSCPWHGLGGVGSVSSAGDGVQEDRLERAVVSHTMGAHSMQLGVTAAVQQNESARCRLRS